MCEVREYIHALKHFYVIDIDKRISNVLSHSFFVSHKWKKYNGNYE